MKRKRIIFLCVIAGTFLFYLICRIPTVHAHLWAYANTRSVPSQIRENLYTVFVAYKRYYITGEEWETGLGEQIHKIHARLQPDRVLFYRYILICCADDLDTSRLLTLWEGIGNDRQTLLEDLRLFQKSSDYAHVNKAAKEIIDYFIVSLPDQIELDRKPDFGE